MSISNDSIEAVPEYTNDEMVKMLRAAILAVTLGQSYSINGREVNRANLKDLMAALDYFQDLVDEVVTTDVGGGAALVQFGERI